MPKMTGVTPVPWRRTNASRAAVRRPVALLLLFLVVAATSYATVSPARGATASTRWTLRDAFSREVVRPGAVDADPYRIEHVYEVQYRLKRLGLFDATPNGRFGPVTEAGVKRFQMRNALAPTGIVGYRTWRPLIEQSVRGKGAVPSGCRSAGWHACYDRWWHQVNLYHDGVLLNSWLVRGGAASTPTRTGTFRAYYRDIDHVSSTFANAPMPYAQFFSGGQALHGSRLMMSPYVGHSHGCVNLWTEDAQQLWSLTSTQRLQVHVYGRWS